MTRSPFESPVTARKTAAVFRKAVRDRFRPHDHRNHSPSELLLVHPSAELYGSDRVFLESVRALTGAGHRVLVVLPQRGPLVPYLRRTGARVHHCPTAVLRKSVLHPTGLLGFLRDGLVALPAMLRLLSHRYAAVYISTITVPTWTLLAAALGHRVVTHVHEAEDTQPLPVRVGLTLPLLASRSVVVNSRAAASVLHRAIPRLRDRTSVIYNGVAGPGNPRVDTGNTRPGRLVLVGRLSPRKGTDTAVRALALLRERGHPVTLDLIGSVFDGYEWFEREIERLVRAHGLWDSVRLHGFDSDVWHHYAEADIALVPSRFEPFGNTAVEAQLAGLPVVVTDVQGLPETVGDGSRGHIVEADDPEALADGVERLLIDWPGALELAEHARHEAAALFAPERYHDSLRKTINELTAPGTDGRRVPRRALRVRRRNR
ncbi:glycosyltransferase involved in cell wall biosynthesis [Actinopolyspora lacussalsi]|nr:glycosyltransferase involved in cell wall biosynthesis [Actinopolyspora lacussalsi]